jgi:site-specific recombinase XerD
MKSFESFLAPKMKEYIKYRYNLGYKTKDLKSSLMHFDQYLQKTHLVWEDLDPLFFLNLRESLKKDPAAVNLIINCIRNFFQFLIREGILDTNPLQDIPPLKKREFIPFVFSEEEIDALLYALRENIRKKSRFFLKDFSLYCAILLQAQCGLRISEPRNLLRSHFHAKERCIYIEKSKFKKDRLIPMPDGVRIEITNYLNVRQSLLKDDKNPYLLYAGMQQPLSKDAIYRTFHKGVKDCGLYQPRRIIGSMIFGAPTPHSLRHAFAINTLWRAKKKGKSPHVVLPYLAAYMGHSKYRDTAVYLKVVNAQERKALADFTRPKNEDI